MKINVTNPSRFVLYFFPLLLGLFFLLLPARHIWAIDSPTNLLITKKSACAAELEWTHNPFNGAADTFKLNRKKGTAGLQTFDVKTSIPSYIASQLFSCLDNNTPNSSNQCNLGSGYEPGTTITYYNSDSSKGSVGSMQSYNSSSGDYSTWANFSPLSVKLSEITLPSGSISPNINKWWSTSLLIAEGTSSGISIDFTNTSTPSSFGGYVIKRIQPQPDEDNFVNSIPFSDSIADTSNKAYRYEVYMYESEEFCNPDLNQMMTDPSYKRAKLSSSLAKLTVPRSPLTFDAMETSNGINLVWTYASPSLLELEPDYFILIRSLSSSFQNVSTTKKFVISGSDRNYPDIFSTDLYKTYYYRLIACSKDDDSQLEGCSEPIDTQVTTSAVLKNLEVTVMNISGNQAKLFIKWDTIGNFTVVTIEKNDQQIGGLNFIQVNCQNTNPEDDNFCFEASVPLGSIWKYKIDNATAVDLLGNQVPVQFINNEYDIDLRISPLAGWAWSDNIGWISFNCESDNSCDFSNPNQPIGYLVYANTITGYLGGYAWSDNMGWLNFDGGHIDLTTGAVTGTARFCSVFKSGCSGAIKPINGTELGGWDGFVQLSDNNFFKSPVFSQPFEGVTYKSISSSDGELVGYAWGDMNVGWISFNCANDTSCGTSNYKVTLIPPTNIPSNSLDLKIRKNKTTPPLDLFEDGPIYLPLPAEVDLSWESPDETVFDECEKLTVPVLVPPLSVWNGLLPILEVPGKNNNGFGPFISDPILIGKSPTGVVTLWLTCRDANKNIYDDFVAIIDSNISPSVNLSCSNFTETAADLSWTSVAVSSCSATPWSSQTVASGTEAGVVIDPLAVPSQSFTITCTPFDTSKPSVTDDVTPSKQGCFRRGPRFIEN